MRSLRIFLLTVLFTLSSCGDSKKPFSQEIPPPSSYEIRLDKIYESASFPIDRERCRSGLLEVIRKAERGEDVWSSNEHLRSEKCLDRYTYIGPRRKPAESAHFFVSENLYQVCISSFEKDTTEMFRKNLPPPSSSRPILLDLRGNRGGLLGTLDGESTGVLGIAEFFAPYADAPIVTLFSKEGIAKTFRARERGLLAGARIVVLINESTASAAEILAGALQLWYDADLIGHQSYGKGVHQAILSDELTEIYVTAGRFLVGAPEKSIEIEGRGLRPTIEAESLQPLHDCFRPLSDEAGQDALQILGLP